LLTLCSVLDARTLRKSSAWATAFLMQPNTPLQTDERGVGCGWTVGNSLAARG